MIEKMLTPVDIQQKKFRSGFGYEKKDVNAFFDVVSDAYEKLYRSNAELKEKVITLTDGLQNYKSKEKELEKTIMIAEKDSEDTKSRAQKEAKNIELEAKNKAKLIVSDAEKQLAEINQKISELETQYAAYKSNFVYFMQKQFEMLEVEDFDPKSYIDEKSLQSLGVSVSGSSGSYKSSGPNMPFGSFEGDPQMRDESTLGGFGGGSSSMRAEDKVSTSAVYTSNLAAGENFVDPFNPDANKQNGRYNPYDGRTAAQKKASKSSQTKKTQSASSAAKKASEDKKDETVPKEKSSSTKEADAKIKDIVNSASESKSSSKAESAESDKPKKPVVDNIFTFEKDIKSDVEDKIASESSSKNESDSSEEIPTVDFDSEEVEVEVETVKDSNLLGNGDDEDSEDFEFV